MSDNQENLEELLEKAEERKNLCKILSIASELTSTRWSRILTWLGIPNAILAAISSVSIATGDQKKIGIDRDLSYGSSNECAAHIFKPK